MFLQTASGAPGTVHKKSREDRIPSLRLRLVGGLMILLFVALFSIAIILIVGLRLELPPGSLILVTAMGMAAGFALLAAMGDYRLGSLVLRPLDAMVAGTERIASGDKGHRLDRQDTEELRRLAAAINTLADQLILDQRRLVANIESLDRTNRSLTEARNEVIAAAKLVSTGQLAAGVAHEVGNPLGAILGYVEIARRRDTTDGEWLDGISNEVTRIDRIVRGLLDYARPKRAATRRVDVNAVVREAVELVSMQGRFKGIESVLDLADDLPEVLADPHQLQQVLINLLLNAADSIGTTDRAGRVEVVTTSMRTAGPPATSMVDRRDGDPEGLNYSHLRRWNEWSPEGYGPHLREGTEAVRLLIKDNGAGLADAAIERVFDPFYTTKDPGSGTGLGLSVSARLINGMGGAIDVLESTDVGATFELLLPVASGEAAA